MNKSRVIFTIAYLTLLCPLPGSAETPKTKSPGFSISITAPAEQIKAGTKVVIDIVMKNIVGSEIFFLEGPNNGFDVSVTDEAGKEMGSMEQKSPDVGPPVVTVLATLPLEPGEKHRTRFSLAEYKALTAPGKYFVQVSKRDMESGSKVASNKLEIIVVP